MPHGYANEVKIDMLPNLTDIGGSLTEDEKYRNVPFILSKDGVHHFESYSEH